MAIGLMDIGRAARESGVSVKMIRHYEAIGLVPKAVRTAARYRLYSSSDVQLLRFIRGARHVGLRMGEIRELVSLWQDRSRFPASVKKLARKHIHLLEIKAQEINMMVAALERLSGSSRSG